MIVETIIRLVPGVLGNDGSAKEDSFYDGLLDFPHYTRPSNFRGHGVPETLLSGNHKEIRRWRRKEALRRTLERRPDLLERFPLRDEDREILEEISNER